MELHSGISIPQLPKNVVRATKLVLILVIVFVSAVPALAIFYGEDDYVEIDQISERRFDVDWSTIARSVAVVLPNPENNKFDFSNASSMRSRFQDPPLRSDYKYGDQPSVAYATAFLIDSDKVMTCGHAGIRRLEGSSFLFDFIWDTENKRLEKSRYEDSEIYRCTRVLLHRNDRLGDYAICQLDKHVRDRRPLSLKAINGAATIDQIPAKMISAPDGTPLKMTNDGKVLGHRPSRNSPELNLSSYFFHTLDNSGGSSGAPIFDALTGEVIGIQSGGDDNFTRLSGFVVPTRGNFEDSNLGRPLRGEWGSLIPQKALTLVTDN